MNNGNCKAQETARIGKHAVTGKNAIRYQGGNPVPTILQNQCGLIDLISKTGSDIVAIDKLVGCRNSNDMIGQIAAFECRW